MASRIKALNKREKRHMKKLVLFTLLFLMATKLFASDKDTILTVNLEASQSVPYGVNLVFENISNDSISLFSKFQNFIGETGSNSGFMMLFYKNKQRFREFFDEMPPDLLYYSFSNGIIIIPPHKQLKLSIPLRPFLWRIDEKSEYGARFIINYSYIHLHNNLDNRWKEHLLVTTNYTTIKNIKETKNKKHKAYKALK
jgi:hypothetical protein